MSGHSRLFHLEEIMSDPGFGYKGSCESLSTNPQILSEDHSRSMKFSSLEKRKNKNNICIYFTQLYLLKYNALFWDLLSLLFLDIQIAFLLWKYGDDRLYVSFFFILLGEIVTHFILFSRLKYMCIVKYAHKNFLNPLISFYLVGNPKSDFTLVSPK